MPAAGTPLWFDFTYETRDEVLTGLAHKTRNQLATVFGTVERLLSPARIGDVTAARLSKLVGALREEGKSPYTIRNYHGPLPGGVELGSPLACWRRSPYSRLLHGPRTKRV